MLNVIWYAHTSCFYVTLTPVGGSEQALVDTRFPAIYGKQRGVQLHSYDEDKGFSGELDARADGAWAAQMALRATAGLAVSRASWRGRPKQGARLRLAGPDDAPSRASRES